ncbi:nuclear transport factor 2 family protein [Larkinella sp. GY13]|uniref:nuclear transport factor 2 family protein n=1 Tax=Larkinella sp. GY13 TaxID=3453720 RepID=UPI003EEC0BD9
MRQNFSIIKTGFLAFLLLITVQFAQATSDTLETNHRIPPDFVTAYYNAYSGLPKAERLSPFYADDVILEDPTFHFVGKGRQALFQNFDQANLPNTYRWDIHQQIIEGNHLVTEGLLHAHYFDLPYTMRFVNIFHFKDGKIVRQYDYYDTADYDKVVEAWKVRKTNETK